MNDALVITALGMAVVFIGLILTALLITAFGALARFEEGRTRARQLFSQPAAAVATGPVDEAVLAVIAAVLEVERRLHHAEVTGRLTIVHGEDSRRIP